MEKTPDTVYVIYIAASPEQIWDALRGESPRRTSRRRIEPDWKQGSLWTLWMRDGQVDVQGKVLVSERPLLLEVTWHVEWNEEAEPARVPG